MYGLLSDTVPIGGLHRAPYLLAGLALGAVGYGIMAVAGFRDEPLDDTAAAALLFLAGGVGTALPDAIFDVTVAERTRDRPELGAQLQALLLSAQSAAALLMSAGSGFVQQYLHSAGGFAIASACTLPAAWAVLSGGLGEQRAKEAGSPESFAATQLRKWRAAVLLCWRCARVPLVAKTLAFQFLCSATQPSLGSAMFFWMTAPEGANLSPVVYSSVLGTVANLFGSKHSLAPVEEVGVEVELARR